MQRVSTISLAYALAAGLLAGCLGHAAPGDDDSDATTLDRGGLPPQNATDDSSPGSGGSGGSGGGNFGSEGAWAPNGGDGVGLAGPGTADPGFAAPQEPSEPSEDHEPQDDDHDAEWSWFQLSPDDSTSMATAQVLKRGHIPWGMPLRAHEVINYYDPPASYREQNDFAHTWELGDGLELAIAGRRAPEAEGVHGLALLIHAYAALPPAETRRAYTLHLCVDVSGSMAGERMAFTKDGLRRLIQALQEGDRVSLTTFQSHGELVLGTLEVSENRETLLAAIDDLVARGGTNMRDGLDIAYAEAQRVLDGDSLHRVILFSDGAANVGATDLESFAELTRSQFGEGIYLSGVGVGDQYDFARMNAITDAGRGAHVFLPHADEVGVIFGPMLRKLIEVAVDEVSIEVQLPRGFTLDRFSGEETSTNPEQRVQNIVLASGDDLTLLADFVTEDADRFDEEMILTFRYQPLGGEAQVFEAQFPIADLFEGSTLLHDRTRLLQRYGELGIEGFQVQQAACQLREEILEFDPLDDGLLEVAGVLASQGGCDAS